MDWKELPLDPRGATPIYQQIRDGIAVWIKTGVFRDGVRLPPTRELAAQLGLNRNTVAAAYEALETDGLLKAHVGRGSFVCSPAPEGALEWERRFRMQAPDRTLQTLFAVDGDCVNFTSSRPDPGIFPIHAVERAAQKELAARGSVI
ncbi:MAG: GntR family transcriptional regulator, partial [Terriglobia bacterium]